MKAAATILTLDEYLDLHFEPESELIGGEVRPKPLGSDHHSRLCTWLSALLLRQAGLARTRIELSIRVGDDVLIPDVCVLRDRDKKLYRDILAEPPLLCVEVVSPSQRPSEMLTKCERYHEFGVPYCWVVDPVARRAWQYHAGGKSGECTAELTAGELKIALAELFSEE